VYARNGILKATGDGAPVKPLIWIGSSREDLKTFPARVPEEVEEGIQTSQADIELVKRRLSRAAEIHEERFGRSKGARQ